MRAHGGSDIRDVNQNSENWAVVKAALVAGMYPNLAHVDQETALLSSSRKKKLHFHPTSVLNQSQLKEVGQPFPPYIAVSTALHPRELRIIHVCRGLGLLSQSGNKELYEHQDSGNICAVITVAMGQSLTLLLIFSRYILLCHSHIFPNPNVAPVH